LQVANVWRAQSADGLSALSFELESWGLLVHTGYGFTRGLPFSAYGEAGILFAQNVLLLALVYRFARLPLSRALAALIVAVSAVFAVATGAGVECAASRRGSVSGVCSSLLCGPGARKTRAHVLTTVPRSCTPPLLLHTHAHAGQVGLPLMTRAYDANNLILIAARLPQIYKNFASRSTGQLSVITFGANTLGCVARLFTTLQEGGGSAMMRSYALSECAREG
jgi:mannose-P-dolichol utilization defect protein 1